MGNLKFIHTCVLMLNEKDKMKEAPPLMDIFAKFLSKVAV